MTAPSSPPDARPTLVSDFDGTITARDFFELARAELQPPGEPDHWADYLAGRITHFDALRKVYAAVAGGEAELVATADRMEPDPDLAAEVHALAAAGWRVVVASAGCAWYIDRHLGRAGVAGAIEVHANPGRIVDGRLRMERPPRDAWFWSHEVGIDKVAVVRRALAGGGPVAFSGDGMGDVAAALLVPPIRRFARAALAAELTRRGEPFRPFGRWADVAWALRER